MFGKGRRYLARDGILRAPSNVWCSDDTQFFRRVADARRDGKRLAKAGGIGFDPQPRSITDLRGPGKRCGLCDKPLGRSFDSQVCTRCRTVHWHGQDALEDKQLYIVGSCPGDYNPRSVGERRGVTMEDRRPLAHLLAKAMGSVLESGSLAESEPTAGEVGVSDLPANLEYLEYVVRLTPSQAEAWCALVQWVHDTLEHNQQAALQRGASLWTRLAEGSLSIEEFNVSIGKLEQGRIPYR